MHWSHSVSRSRPPAVLRMITRLRARVRVLPRARVLGQSRHRDHRRGHAGVGRADGLIAGGVVRRLRVLHVGLRLLVVRHLLHGLRLAPAGLNFGYAGPAGGEHAQQQLQERMRDEKPERRLRLRLIRVVRHVQPTLAVAELVEHGEEEQRVDDVVDEQEGAEAVDVRGHFDLVEGLLAQVAGEEVAAAWKGFKISLGMEFCGMWNIILKIRKKITLNIQNTLKNYLRNLIAKLRLNIKLLNMEHFGM